MSESPIDKTSRKIANLLEHNCFEYQATVFLSHINVECNLEDVKTAKKLIKADNPTAYILSFISQSTNKGTGEQQPYICFYSWTNLLGISLREAQCEIGFRIAGERSDQPRRRLISRHLKIDQMEGTIRRIREEKVFDLNMYFGDEKFRRYSFLNDKHKPSEDELKAIQHKYRGKRDALYASRHTKP